MDAGADTSVGSIVDAGTDKEDDDNVDLDMGANDSADNKSVVDIATLPDDNNAECHNTCVTSWTYDNVERRLGP